MTLIFGRLFLFYFCPVLMFLSTLFYVIDCDFFVRCSVLVTLSIVAWSIAYWVWENVNSEIVTDKNKIVVITGCDSGFGHSLAKRLDRFGFHVFACVYSIESEGAKALKIECSPRITVVQMDVTKPEQIESVVQQVREKKLPLHAVINNAGIILCSGFDFGQDIEILQKTFDVNVYGMVRVTRAFINLLRQSKGRVVNVASFAGRLTIPSATYYCMSKHSVRSFSDGIRRELWRHGIKVITIEPCVYKTEMLDFDAMMRGMRHYFDRSPEETKKYYDESYFGRIERSERMLALLSRDREEVVDAMEKATTNINIKPYIRCCGYQDLIFTWFVGILPETFADYLLSFV